MRFLLDTNIIIPLEDSSHVLEVSLANVVRLAHEHNHQLVYHPATEDDFSRDTNTERRLQNLARIRQYSRLADRPDCPWNTAETNPNDAADNEILYALQCDAVHGLITEDRGIHDKARTRGLVHRVYTIQTAEDLLRRLHERTSIQLPNIEDINLYSLSPQLTGEFFNSLREGYPSFDDWFREKARSGTKAWVTWERPGVLGAICIYIQQDNETITEEGLRLSGSALKLSTFKVGPSVRGRKIGELFLKAAFRYATANQIENIFIHGDVDQHHFLFEMLEEFGFQQVGTHPGSGGRDVVYLKSHPIVAPRSDIEPFEYLKTYFPHFRHDEAVNKYIIPIQPVYHRILFPDYDSHSDRQLTLFRPPDIAGNAIKLAYLSHAQTRHMNPGDILLFYRSRDERAVTSIGIVEEYDTTSDAGIIAGRVKRRTVYTMEEIERMASRPTRVMLFRLVKHLERPRSQAWLEEHGIINGAPQSITHISHNAFERVLDNAE